MFKVYLLDGLRTAIGKFGGRLSSLRPTEFTATVVSELIKRTGIPLDAVEQVIAGKVVQDLTESNPARIVARRVGIPDSAPAFTLNMQCASGMAALILAAQQIAMGNADCVLALGMESLSRAPFMLSRARWGYRLGNGELVDTVKESGFAGSKMWGDPWTMIEVAEHHAKVDGITRAEMDDYALQSHQKAAQAVRSGRLKPEIVPIEVLEKRGETQVFEVDEHVRNDIDLDELARLNPIMQGGSITAGNSSGLNDAGAAGLVVSEKFISDHSLTPLAEVDMRAGTMIGCDPTLMGYSANEALDMALSRAGLVVDDLDLIECNEGFAVQLVACARKGNWPLDRLNLDGGSVGLGHPVGMSGLRIAVHLAHALVNKDLSLGAATVPAGSGLGAAIVLKRT
ncbi:MAG: thiolase family protein [Actinobacteria bacterium]|nr:thiolase family protein [Actinomycetota bacterium]MCL6104577.1 thiolase family protein [Actinomycetota bacterium]